jgi:anti-anti-sigma factor
VNDFTARVEGTNGDVTIVLSGELDMATVRRLEQALEGLTGQICFDCTDLTFVDSSGLAVFSRVDRNGGATLRNPSAQVCRLLKIVGLEHLATGA